MLLAFDIVFQFWFVRKAVAAANWEWEFQNSGLNDMPQVRLAHLLKSYLLQLEMQTRTQWQPFSEPLPGSRRAAHIPT